MSNNQKIILLDNLSIILFRPKFSENIGAAARACANMGCSNLILVDPQEWDIEKANKLATQQAKALLENIQIFSDLPSCLAPFHTVFGTTARTGGWRKGLLTPTRAAPNIVNLIQQQARVAIVFGPEDKGLTNVETETCSNLLTIPTSEHSTSLNLAQAVLIVLYECFTQAQEHPFRPKRGVLKTRMANHEERETLMKNFQETLVAIDFLKSENTDYFMLPVRRFFSRFKLYLNEYNMLMGICRQVKWIADKNPKNN